MTGALRERTLLAPAGDAAVHELRVAREAGVGAKPQALGDPRPKSFDQRVGALDEVEHDFHGAGILEIERNGIAVAQQRVVFQRTRNAELPRLLAIDAQHRRAQIGEQHRAHRPGADAGELDDFQAVQRSHIGATSKSKNWSSPRKRGPIFKWIPACAGMTCLFSLLD